jgi:uncharacterized protein (TIGR02391 family)
MELESLLHPAVAQASLKQFRDGHYRDAVLNGIIATFALLRTRTGLDLDGVDLVNKAFSERYPYLIVGDLNTESGRNAQLGVMQLARGLFQGIRNPAAHNVFISLSLTQAARYLVMASALAQIIDDAQQGDVLRFDGVYAAASEAFGTHFVRFFTDGTVLGVAVGTHVSEDWIPDWLTISWAQWQGKYSGTYTLNTNRLTFSILSTNGEVQYEGQIQGQMIRMRSHSTGTGQSSQKDSWFRPYLKTIPHDRT